MTSVDLQEVASVIEMASGVVRSAIAALSASIDRYWRITAWPSCIAQANATCATVAPCRCAMPCSTGSPSTLP